ncbi:DNA polymerase alpha catalytic subunit [Histomonas meleagridis]|uniref:DNA polymerase alpha catalytic subunit n=1 Tax=Histomonas meleagridis TaxID=135588 RepID=UPI0035596B3F|nr:DNA polymerase alpha catalytic subunit [Histomonas meleagridis]KAH0806383.1 DNA polymerase alpha catalytic subunit [Histomonas meleagridis]
MSKRASRHSIANTKEDKEKIRMALSRSADFSSESDSQSEISETDSDDEKPFVVDGVYADDYHPQRKKKREEKPSGPTLKDFLLKNASKEVKKENVKPKQKPKKESEDMDLGLQNMLEELNNSDEEQTRRKSKHTKRQIVKKPSLPPTFNNNPLPPNNNNDQVITTPKIEKKEVISPKENAHPAPTIPEKPRQVIFDIQPIESNLDDSFTEEIASSNLVNLDLPDQGSIDVFLFHIHEEGGKLFLFCRYLNVDNYITICIKVSTPLYYIQFLPIPNHEEELKEEVQSLSSKLKCGIVSMEYQSKNYAFDNLSIPKRTSWLCVSFTSKLRPNEIPSQGNHYSNVLGITSTLAESFILREHLRGPTWITINNPKQFGQTSTIPMITIPNITFIKSIPLEQIPQHIPNFNLCTISLRSLHNEKTNENEIFLISLRILYKWNIEIFQSSGSKQMIKNITFASSLGSTSLSRQYCRDVMNREDIQICTNEQELLSKFVETLDKYDIDLISSYGLVTYDGPLLIERMKKFNISNWWKLGRLKRTNPHGSKANFLTVISGRVPIDLRISCTEFLRVKDTNFSSIVKEHLNEERQQIDHFLIREMLSDYNSLDKIIKYNIRDTIFVSRLLQTIQTLPLTLQISQLSGCPWERVLLGQATHRCESLLLHEFFERDYVLPEKLENLGPLKRISKYKGGMVLEPQRGFYDTCIVVLDFNSLYPSIIREFNICFTTVNRENPDANASRKSKINGVLPSIMTDLLNARKQIKNETAKLKKTQDTVDKNSSKFAALNQQLLKLSIKERAVKVLANSMYGYLGYKNSRFQAKELAALITEKGREILNATKTSIENKQFQVIYGDTDSVMVNTRTKDVDEAKKIALKLSELISKNYRCLVLGVDFIFEKMLLVQKKKYAAFVHEEPPRSSHIETKGLDMVRRDWSPLTKTLSGFIIQEFMSSNSENDDVVQNILDELEVVADMMRNGGNTVEKESRTHPKGIALSKLFLSKTLKKPIDKYPENDSTPHVVVARELIKKGNVIQPNETIKYIICNSDDKEVSKKAKYYLDVQSFEEADVNWYLTNQLLHPLWRLCEPFGGIQQGQISRALGIQSSLSFNNYQSDDNSYSSIPTLFKLTFHCTQCAAEIEITPFFNKCIICPNCNFHNNWKFVANQLILQ